MKFILKTIIYLLVITPTSLFAQDEILTGEISKSDLMQESYSSWYAQSENSYQVDMETVADIETLLKDIDVTIVMGTWCHDSKREIPRLYKILEAAGSDLNRVRMIAVDRTKTAPGTDVDQLSITNTPTIIFTKHGAEMNRIVETPVSSLELDMKNILSAKPYKHSKMN
jgi:thiol-disulfide isomerase/thioredoxin